MKRLYPRPQLKRKEWTNLNGNWDFAFDDAQVGIQEKWYLNKEYTKEIEVPFPYQAKLSGIHDKSEHDHVWYHKTLHITKKDDHLTLLHFGAVDYEATVYLNGTEVMRHTGGSSSFTVDITSYIELSSTQELTIHVYDPSRNSFISRGKQTWKEEPFECFYDRTTGIWQTVWLEHVPIDGIERVEFTPNIDQATVQCTITTNYTSKKSVELQVYYDQEKILTHTVEMTKKDCFQLHIPKEHLYLWSPEDPNLYNVSIRIIKDTTRIDMVSTYFAMRKISVDSGNVLLNNKPYYLRLILDQGYYPEGLLTYPDEETLQNDIILAKEMGFNGCRKHEKIEAERFLYYADTLGFLVSLEMPSAYSYKASTDFIQEWFEIIKRDYNHPSVFMYVPFNESWGIRSVAKRKDIQNYQTGFYYLTKSFDPTRIISTNDGWEQTKSDICAIHNYQHGRVDELEKQQLFKKMITTKNDLLSNGHTPHEKDLYVGGYSYKEEPIILSEFGGISFANENQDGWGYTGVSTTDDFKQELKRLFDVIYESKHLAGFCYTQLTDVEQEINGLLDYDRNAKIPLQEIHSIIMNKKDTN